MKKKPFNFLMILLLSGASLVTACKDDEVPIPPAENEEEIITDVKLIFTSSQSDAPIVVTATDPDGEGPQDLQTNQDIVLAANTIYTLNIELENSVAGEDITKEIQEEADEHLFFFGWTNNLFSNPEGDGNIDNRSDPVDYTDSDADKLPVGLSTTWTTGEASTGTFRVVLKHQPDVKSETSTVQDGETDLDISWNITIQ